MSKISSREAAVLALYAVFYKSAYSNIEINNIIQKHGLDPIERSLCSKLVYGVIENSYLLDYYINKFSKVKVEKMSPHIACILRMSLYQIIYLTKIPHSAVCNEAAELAKKFSNGKLTGFVNGVLRSILRSLDTLKPPKCKNKTTQLSIEYSLPLWLVNHFINQYGQKDGVDIIKSCNAEPTVYIRLNTILADQQTLKESLLKQGADIEEVDSLKNTYKLKFEGDITSLEAFVKGMFFVQDLSSQLCVYELELKDSDTFIDLCCAPGSKSFTAAGYMNNLGKIYGFELHQHRVQLVLKAAKRLGIEIIDCTEKDSSVFDDRYTEIADKVLVDVPCSGLGTLAKKPDIRFKEEKELVSLKEIQTSILNNASRYLKNGGILIYSTCTLNKAENEDIIAQFLKENNNFELCKFKHELLKKDGGRGYITIMPKFFESDGFFIAKMIKK